MTSIAPLQFQILQWLLELYGYLKMSFVNWLYKNLWKYTLVHCFTLELLKCMCGCYNVRTFSCGWQKKSYDTWTWNHSYWGNGRSQKPFFYSPLKNWPVVNHVGEHGCITAWLRTLTETHFLTHQIWPRKLWESWFKL